MATDRWTRLEQLFAEAVDRPAHTRAAFLERACGSDVGLLDELSGLLTAADVCEDFLRAPAIEILAQEIVRDGWAVRPGDRIGSYAIERRLGAGAMGEVWRARDERLARPVAIKLLLPHPSTIDRLSAFAYEARAAGALNHPNVLTVYDVGDHRGAPFLVTECLEGQSLRARLGAGPLSIDEALDIAAQVAQGLGAAHQQRIVHRDLKPENIFLARDGRVKILDFGLATLLDTAVGHRLTAGTAGYMAPEHVRGETVDGRADIFAVGVVLYEMLAGRGPFKGTSTRETLNRSVTLEPRDVSEPNPEVQPPLSRIVARCLAKRPEDRFTTVGDLATALDAVIQARRPMAAASLRAFVRKPSVIATLTVLLAVLLAGGWQWRTNASRAHWARTVAAPEIQRLSNRGEYAEAFLLAREALDIVPDDPHVRQLWLDVSVPAVMTTEPPGAEVAFASYRRPTAWFSLGRTPLDRVRIPRTLIRLRVSKPGFQPIEGSGSPGALPRFRLDPIGAVPSGMVRVVGGRGPARFESIGDLEDFWIDRFEVTNREFKAFVDQGGYQRREYWREPFVEHGRPLTWEEAVARFRDATGQPGPATWTSGTYATGASEFPVGGVSWYEAAAYAAFAGKSLPTIYHWYRAANLGRFADILTVSNFNGQGPSPVGSFNGIGAFGTFDMAGNVKEWCWNETANGRFILGGAWNEARYTFSDDDARDPFERAPANGFRLARYPAPLPLAVTAAVGARAVGRDLRAQQPVDDDIFAVYRRQHAYDHTPLDALVETTEQTDLWLEQTVAFDAGYGDERMRAHLFLPKRGSPPYQTVVFFPPADAFQLRSSRDMSLAAVDFIVRSGRAFCYPVYKGTYERATRQEIGLNEERDMRIAWSRDFGRSLDYLVSRSDIDAARLAFYGVSSGADAGIVLSALEPRLKTAVLQGTGLPITSAPEFDPVNFAPRIFIPTLMLNGRYDFDAPVETSQRPLFALIGSPSGLKRHAIFESGHALSIDDAAREILPWLDRHLGRVVDPR